MAKSLLIIVGFIFWESICFCQPTVVVPIGHTRLITHVAFSHNGKYILTASQDKTAKLWDFSSSLLVYTLPAYSGWVTKAIFSSDDKYMLTISANNVRIWNTTSGKLFRTLYGNDEITDAKYDRDGKYIITGSKDGTAKIWYAATGKVAYNLNNNSHPILAIDVNNKNNSVLAATKDSVMLWNLSTGHFLFNLVSDKYLITDAKFSPDGKIIVVAWDNYKAKMWYASSGKFLKNLDIDTVKQIYDKTKITFSHDGKFLLTTYSSQIKIWKFPEGENIHTIKTNGFFQSVNVTVIEKQIVAIKRSLRLNGDTLEIFDIAGNCLKQIGLSRNYNSCYALSPNEESIVTASGFIPKIWDFKNGTISDSLFGHSILNNDLRISEDEKYLLSRSEEGVKIWDLSKNKLSMNITGKNISHANFSCNNTMILTVSANIIELRKMPSGELINAIDNNSNITNAFFSHDSKLVFASSEDGTAKALNVSDGSVKYILRGHTKKISDILQSHNDKYLLTISDDKSARIWDSTGKPMFDLPHNSSVSNACFSNDDKYVFTINLSTLNKWEVNSGIRSFSIRDSSFSDEWGKYYSDSDIGRTMVFFRSVEASSDNNKVLTSSFQNEVKIWDAKNGKLLSTMLHANYVNNAIFSRDGNYIITSSGDNTAAIWDTSGKLIFSFIGHTNNVSNAILSPKGDFLMTSAEDGTIKRWNTKTGNLVYTIIGMDLDDYVFIRRDNYFMGTHQAAKLIHYLDQSRIVSFEQVDLKFNRPDILLANIPGISDSVLNIYKNAYFKRITILGIDTTAVNNFADKIPETEIINRESIGGRTFSQDAMAIHIKSKDENDTLITLNVWVNAVPVYGEKGRKINFIVDPHRFDSSVVIQLSRGVNIIKVSLANSEGLESYITPIKIWYKPND